MPQDHDLRLSRGRAADGGDGILRGFDGLAADGNDRIANFETRLAGRRSRHDFHDKRAFFNIVLILFGEVITGRSQLDPQARPLA